MLMPECIPINSSTPHTPQPQPALSTYQLDQIHERYEPDVACAYIFLHRWQAKVFFTLLDEHRELMKSIRLVLGEMDRLRGEGVGEGKDVRKEVEE